MELSKIIEANKNRTFASFFDENIKAYDENLNTNGKLTFQNQLNKNFQFVDSNSLTEFYGEEISPFLQLGLGIKYPLTNPDTLISNSSSAFNSWKHVDLDTKYNILVNALKNVQSRFFELAYATMHTTGQSFLMSFQASGPHCCDRALEVMATAYEQLTYFPKNVEWVKNFGKFDLKLNKNYKPIPRGISLAIGCSTFPTWNTIPGVFASLITGNTVIIKPHPKAVYPIAIFVDELKKELANNNLDTNTIQLAIDSTENPLTKILAENKQVKLIDYTGGNFMGDYIESLNKVCFTEKAGINSVILHSTNDLMATSANIAFSISLYSGQMCTAPQNIYIPETGIQVNGETIPFDAVVQSITDAINGLMNNEKAAAPTLGAIQNDATIKRIENVKLNNNNSIACQSIDVKNAEFTDARILSPSVLVTDSANKDTYLKEVFGPLVFVVKTKNNQESLEIVKQSAENHGAITCLCYSTDNEFNQKVEDEMNSVFTPVSFNFKGAAFVNQHAAFSDFHVSGGNPSGNATFTNADFINKRYIWIGNRYML